MVTIQFFLKNPKERKSPIYIAVHVKGKRLTPISIGESVLCDQVDKKGKITKGDWDKDKQRVRKSHDFADELNHKIEGIYLSVGRTFRQMLERGENPNGYDLQALVKPGSKKTNRAGEPKTFSDYAKLWKASVLAKENRGVDGWQKLPEKKQKGYGKVRKINPVMDKLEEYKPNLLVSEMIPPTRILGTEPTFADRFFEWLQNENPDLQDTSLNNYSAGMRLILKFAGMPYEWVNSPRRGKATKYSLTWGEILQLKNTTYSTEEAKNAADVAVIVSQLALRWSDFSTLNSLHFEQVKSKKHGLVWCINKNQTKTGNAVMVPVPPIATALLEKHNFIIPIPRTRDGNAHGPVLAQHMKLAAKEAKLNRQIRQTKTINKEVIEFWKPLHELLSAHDLRHTGATLVAQASKSRELAKHFLGHAGEGVTDLYLHLDLVDDLLDAWQKIEAGD